jgi:serine/threonine protein kinase
MGGGVSRLQAAELPLQQQQLQLHENIYVDYLLGQGGYSQVYHGIDYSAGKHVAVKIISLRKFLTLTLLTPPSSPDESASSSSSEVAFGISSSNLTSLQTIINELHVFQRVESVPFLVPLHCAFRHHLTCYFVMECLSGGDLRNYFRRHGRLDETSVVYLIGCVSSALQHMHRLGVLHRDIKPENIALDAVGRPYLTDFGISVVSTAENPVPLSESSSGTLPYLAPEVLAKGNCHSYQADYWSLGVMAYELLFGCYPHSQRHCSFESIQLVSNEYGWIWSELTQKSKEAAKPSTLSFSLPLSPFVNFETVPRPTDWKKPYPDFYRTLTSRGEVPEDLQLTFPERRWSVSAELKNLLAGLLDIRLPLRLGNLSRSWELVGHECFSKDDLTIDQFPSLESPLLKPSDPDPGITEDPTPHLLRRLIAKSDALTTEEARHSMLTHLPSQLRDELLQFHYVNVKPSFLGKGGGFGNFTSLLSTSRLTGRSANR